MTLVKHSALSLMEFSFFLCYIYIVVMVKLMDKYIQEFLDYLLYEKKYSENTIQSYAKDLEQYSVYLSSKKINFKNMDYSGVSDYLLYLGQNKYSATSVNRHLSTIRSFYNFLIDKKVVEACPFNLVHGPKKEKKLPNYLKYDEFTSLVDLCDESPLGKRNRMILELLFATGVRVSEAINIKLNDINFKEREIKVFGKGKKTRIVYFNKVCQSVMSDYVLNARQELLKGKKSDYLLLNHLGNPITRRGIEDVIEKLIKKSSLKHKISPHTLRHTFATLLLNEGMDYQLLVYIPM